ncbi:rhomboid-like protein [Kitasatospora paracochleata]|uniref:Integral membrane protein n=1 Tax=Kitasatospora paracochleata TaxID=58354 RepID=A0ABT1IR30_9ACTN|nr:rhomboid-like protein [Kitasatospora paracochleata]MCP2307564.1 hypothetical protein [Kitasatospora paracochleata]
MAQGPGRDRSGEVRQDVRRTAKGAARGTARTGSASRAARARHAVWAWIGAAPGTYLWLLVLAGTSFVVSRLSPETLEWFLAKRSTNIDQLTSRPVHALLASLIWTEQANFLFYFVVFHLFHVPAERWLGTGRWLTVALTAHVLATYASEGVVAWGVHRGALPANMADTVDVGVSYALAGVEGVLTYRLTRPWRWIYGGALLVFYTVPLVASHTFTDLGHFCAVLIGLAFQPITRGLPTWDPVHAVRDRLQRRRSSA